MRLVYTNENRFIVANAKNILAMHRIDIFVKNEYSSSIIGEISAFDSWLELWVINDSDYERACEILETALSHENDRPWICEACQEENDASFELCWQCGKEKIQYS